MEQDNESYMTCVATLVMLVFAVRLKESDCSCGFGQSHAFLALSDNASTASVVSCHDIRQHAALRLNAYLLHRCTCSMIWS